MKKYNLFEYWSDEPDYPESEGLSFVDDELNDVEDLFGLIGHNTMSGLFVVYHLESGKKYISHTDMVEKEYFQADSYSQTDRDEDGSYSYRELDMDNAEMTEESLTMFATISYEEDDRGIDFDQWESGVALIEVTNIILKESYINDKSLYKDIINIIRNYETQKLKQNE
mgnify:CR=1 FL=1